MPLGLHKTRLFYWPGHWAESLLQNVITLWHLHPQTLLIWKMSSIKGDSDPETDNLSLGKDAYDQTYHVTSTPITRKHSMSGDTKSPSPSPIKRRITMSDLSQISSDENVISGLIDLRPQTGNNFVIFNWWPMPMLDAYFFRLHCGLILPRAWWGYIWHCRDNRHTGVQHLPGRLSHQPGSRWSGYYCLW